MMSLLKELQLELNCRAFYKYFAPDRAKQNSAGREKGHNGL